MVRKQLPRRNRSRFFRRLFVEVLEDRLAPATVIFNNPAGGNWGTTSNWSTHALPVAGDMVVIPYSGVTITESQANVSVASVQSAATLDITAGAFQVTSGSSSIGTALTVAGGASLTANGAGTSFTASGSTVIDGADLYATNGATLTLPGVTTDTVSSSAAILEAKGTGSALSLPNLGSVTVGTSSFVALQVEALSTGSVSLPALTQANTAGPVQFVSEGSSTINISALSILAGGNDGAAPTIEATTGGQIQANSLKTLNGVTVSIANSTSTVSLASVTNINDSTLELSGGATLSLPGVTNYSISGTATWEATGTGSSLSLPNLGSATVSTNYFDALLVEALAGGSVNLSDLTQINGGPIQFESESAGSTLDISSLSSFAGQNDGTAPTLEATNGGQLKAAALTSLNEVAVIVQGSGTTISLPILATVVNTNIRISGGATLTLPDVTSNSTFEDETWEATGTGSSLSLPNLGSVTVSTAYFDALLVEALAGGSVNLSDLTQINGGPIQFESESAGSTLDISSLSSFAGQNDGTAPTLEATNGGQLKAAALTSLNEVAVIVQGSGTTISLPILATLIDTDIQISGGATLTLPDVTTGSASSETWEATGIGSSLSMPEFGSVTVSTAYFDKLQVEALAGGSVSLPALTKINTGPIQFESDGSGSILDISALSSFSGINDDAPASLQVTNSGQLQDAALVSLNGVALTLDGTGTLDTNQITSFTNGTLTVTGGTAPLNHLTDLDASSVEVSGAATVTLSAVTSYTDTSANTILKATGIGSLLSLPSLGGVTVGTAYFMQLQVQALAGGSISLADLTQINTGPIDFESDGTGSVLTLSALTNFSGYNDGDVTTLQVTNGGTVHDAALTSLNDVDLTLDGTGTLDTNQITTFTYGTLTLTGGTVSLAGLTDLNGSSVEISGAASATLSAVTSFAVTSGQSTFRATGAGSTLALPNLGSVTVGSGTYVALSVQALSGGAVDLPDLKQINTGPVQFESDGTGSVLTLSALTSFSGSEDGDSPGLQVISEGTVHDAALTSLNGVTLTLDGTGTQDINQITTFTNGVINASGNADFSNLSDADGSSLYATGSATLALPALTRYAGNNSANGTFEANGAGALLDLSNLTTAFETDSRYITETIVAQAGGTVNLNGLSADTGYITSVSATGQNSAVDLSSLTSFGGLAPGNQATLTASTGGSIQLTTGGLSLLQYATVTVTPTGTITGGTLTVGGSSMLSGTGTFSGNVINSGTVEPGNVSLTGQLTITGNYTQTATGTLDFTLQGPQAGTQYTELAIDGTATFGGVLSARLDNYTPSVGASFQVMTFTSVAGSFSSTSGLQVGHNLELDPSATSTTLTLTAAAVAGPTIQTVTPSGTVNTAVSDLDVTFNKLIDLSTLTASQITLTGPDGPITVHNAQLLTGDTYQIAFASQQAQGTYTLQISNQVKDLIGNLMSQPYSGTFTISLPDLVATSISGSATATFGQTIPISWTVTNSGTGAASTSWTDDVYLSQQTTLDNSAILLLSRSETAYAPLASGQQYTVNTTLTLPSGPTTLPGTYYLLLETNATNALTESNTTNDVVASSALNLGLPNADYFINPNGGDWGTASNWSTGAVPTTGTNVIIDYSGVTVTESESNVSIASIHSAADLDITTGTLEVTSGSSSIGGALTLASGATLTATGAGTSFTASGSTDIDGANLYATGGASITLAQLTSYNYTGSFYTTYLEASGSGSTLSLPELTSLATVGPVYSNSIDIEALQGGKVSLPTLGSISPANTAISFIADGAGSQISVPDLRQYNAQYNNIAGYLKVTDDATVMASNLTALSDVHVTLDGTGTLAVGQWASLTGSSLTITGGSYNFGSLTDLTSSTVYAENGAAVSLPYLATYSYTGSVYTTYLEATGSGSTLSLPDLTSLATVAPYYSNNIDIEALNGGKVSLPMLGSVSPANTAVSLIADGAGSQISVADLSYFNALGGDLKVTNSATIVDTALTALGNVTVTLDSTGTLATNQWTSLTSGSLTVTSGSDTFGGLTDVDSSSVYVSGGALVSLPHLTSYNDTSSFGTVYLEATGSGSTLNLPELATLAIVGPVYTNSIDIDALQGGQVSLPSLSSVSAANSDVAFIANDGTLQLTTGNLNLTDAAVELIGTGSLTVGTLTLGTKATLSGTGTISGNVNNGGTVGSASLVGDLTITGNLVQTAAGTLDFYLNGPQGGTQFSQLAINGSVTFGGALNASLGSGYFPSVGSSFQIMTFTAASGSFSSTSGLLLGNNLELDPSATSTTLSLTVAPTQPPTVTNITPSGTVNTAVGAIDVTFSKFINLSTFTASRFTLTGPDGNITVQAPVLLSGDTYEIDFPSQQIQGTYTLQIDSHVTDLVGNALGQSYTGTFTISLPDLIANSLSGPVAADFGQTIPVVWTVTNSGQGAVTNPWTDKIWLSQKTTLDQSAIPLLSLSEAAHTPLAASQPYTINANLTLPLTLTSTAGTYYLLLQTNATNTVTESNTTNDVVASAALTLSLPPSPDLVVKGISGPVSAYTSQSVVVSWTDQNNGTATANGPWVDNIYAASDAQGDNPILLDSYTFPNALTPGASVPLSQLVTLPKTPGTYWLLVTTNASGSVAEGPGSDNNTTVATAPLTVTLPPLPDLVVQSITPPPNGVFSGASVPVSFIVTNAGGEPTSTPYWQDYVILSQDPTLGQTYNGTNDQLLINQPVIVGFANPSYLGAGQSYHQTVDVTLPINAQGTWYVYVVPDGTGNDHPPMMPEASRTDKLAISAGFNVVLSPPADLAVTNVQAPAQDFSGQPMNLTWTVANLGTGPTDTDTWTDAVYMSTKTTLDASATLLDKFIHQGTLTPGDSYTTTESVTLPVGVSGTFYFLVDTDVNGQVFENGATANNVKASASSSATAQTVNLTPPPDLDATSIVPPSTALAGHELTFTYTVTNIGAGATPNYTWNDALYLSPTPTYNVATAISLGIWTHQSSLDAGASYTNTVTAPIPNGLTGAYFVIVDTDSGNVVFELDKTNNELASQTTIQVSPQPADLAVTTVSAPSMALAGTGVLVSWTVANQGAGDTVVSSWQDNVYADTGSTLGTNAVLLGSFPHYGLLDGNDSYSQTQLVTLPLSLSGTYNLFVVTNEPFKSTDPAPVYETNTGNDTSAAVPITIGQQLADLQVVSVTAPTTAVTGASATVAWTVQNSGTASTNSNYWYDDVWMSTNSSLASGGTDVYLGTVQHINPLAAGASYTATGTFTLPSTVVAGTYHFIVATDRPLAPPNDPYLEGVNLVYESNESNNEKTAPFNTTVTVGPTPELSVSNVSVPTTATSGQTLSVGWTVTNNGASTGNVPITDSVYLSYDSVFDSTDRYLGSVTYTGGLAGSASYAQTATLTLPPGVAGPFYVFVETNSNGSIYERNPVTASATAPKPVELILPPTADLVAGSITTPLAFAAGLNITLTYQVTNNGSQPADGSWYDNIYLSPTSTWNVNDPLLGQVLQTHDLTPGESYTGTLTAPLPGVAPGSYYVILRSNILDNYPETTLTNNLSASLTQTVIDAPTLPLGTAQSGTLNEGQALYYKVVVPAGQTLEVTLNSQTATAANELYVSYGTMPTRSQYGFSYSVPFAANQEITVPTTQAGAYYILAYADGVPNISESYTLTPSLVPFSVQAVTPGQVGTGPVTLQISGAQFTSNTTFQLRQGGTIVNASRTLVQDSATAFVTFDLTGQALGSYDIVATQPGQPTSTLAAAVTVVPATPNTLQFNLIVPQVELIGRPGTITISYTNNGNTDLPAQLVFINAENALFQVPGQIAYSTSSLQLFTFNPTGPFGTLPPGFQGSITVSYEPITAGIGVACNFSLEALQDPNEPFDWNAVATNDVPLKTSPQQWAAMVAQAAPLVGNTWGGVVTFLGNHSIQLLADAGPNAGATTDASLYNFDALLQYVVGVYGAPAPVDPPPPYSVIAASGPVTLYNANVAPGGNPIALDYAKPTFLIIPDSLGYQNTDSNLIQALAASGDANVLLATWQTSASTPWNAALQVNSAGQSLATILNSIPQLDRGTLTIIGDGFGTYVANEAALSATGLGNIVALNAPSSYAGYLVPNLQPNFQNSTAYETTSLYDAQTSLASLNQTVDTGDLNNPLLQHAYGITWLTQQIAQGQAFFSDTAALAETSNVPVSNDPPPPSIPELLLLYSAEVAQIAPIDPNNIIGPKGAGTNQGVTNTQLLSYEITCTNVPTANAPAQKVVISDQLDPNLNWQQFRLGSFGFQGLTFQVPDNVSYYQTILNLTQQLGFDVAVTATIDERTGIATWIFSTIDPKTGQTPLNPNIGLLPPNNANGVGEGFVTYTIQASQTVVTGAQIAAQATVTFDTQPPLNTPEIFNTVDTGEGLTSSVAAIPTQVVAGAFNVAWSGVDTANTSAVQNYSIYVSDNGSAYSPWLQDTTLTEATYEGQPGHTYEFYSVATDYAGNIQATPGVAQAVAVVAGAVQPPSSGPTQTPPSGKATTPPTGGSTLTTTSGNPTPTAPGGSTQQTPPSSNPTTTSSGTTQPDSSGNALTSSATAAPVSNTGTAATANTGSNNSGQGAALTEVATSATTVLLVSSSPSAFDVAGASFVGGVSYAPMTIGPGTFGSFQNGGGDNRLTNFQQGFQEFSNLFNPLGVSLEGVRASARLVAETGGTALQTSSQILTAALGLIGLDSGGQAMMQGIGDDLMGPILNTVKAVGNAILETANHARNGLIPQSAPKKAPADQEQEDLDLPLLKEQLIDTRPCDAAFADWNVLTKPPQGVETENPDRVVEALSQLSLPGQQTELRDRDAAFTVLNGLLGVAFFMAGAQGGWREQPELLRGTSGRNEDHAQRHPWSLP